MDKRVIAGGMAVAVAAGLGYWLTRSSKADEAQTTASNKQPGAEQGKAGPRTSAAAPAPATLRGTVVAKDGGAPVEGAVVHLAAIGDERRSGDDPRAARTDSTGRFTLTDVAPGEYAVSAAAPAWIPAVGERVDLAAGGEATVKLELANGGNPITGTVSDISGGPVADAVVSFVPVHGVLSAEPGESFAAMSDAKGAFAVNAADGMYLASARHPDYVSETRRVEIRGAERNVEFALTPGGAIEGVVVNADGKPVPHAMVSYVEERVMSMPGVGVVSEGGRRGGTVAKDDGTFRVTGLSSGAVRLAARGGGGVTGEDTLVGMAIGETVTGVELFLETARAIRGVVVDKASGEPAKGVNVSAMGEGEIAADAETGDDGTFTITDVASGSYMLVADGGGYLMNGFGTPVSVGESDAEGVRIEVIKGHMIAGRVEPAVRAEVGLRLGEETRMSRSILRMGAKRTSGDGTFELGPLAPGEHTVEATAEDGRTGTAKVTLTSADARDVIIELQPGATLAGKVVNAAGAPVTDATVMLKKRGGDREVSMVVNGMEMNAKQSPTHADGSFVIRGLEPGEYALSVKDSDLQPMAWANGKKKDRRVTLAEGEERTGVTLEVETKDGVIKGVAVGPDGKPVADAWVSATASASFAMPEPEESDDGDGPRSRSESRMVVATSDGPAGFGGVKPVLTDADGRFAFRNLRRGKYDLLGRGLAGGARGYARGVETGSDVTLELNALASVEGVVTQAGKPVGQFFVELSGQSQRARSFRDDSGAFTLRRVDPGKHTLAVRSAEGEAELEVVVEAGKKTTVQVELESLVAVRGTVVDEGGKPIAGAMVVTSPDKGDGRVMIAISSSEPPPTTGSDGRFETRVKPGKYRLLVLGEGGGMPIVMKPIEVGETDLELGTLQKSEGGMVHGGPPPGEEDTEVN